MFQSLREVTCNENNIDLIKENGNLILNQFLVATGTPACAKFLV